MPSGSMRESMQVTIATPAWATPSKPARSKCSANSRLAASRSSKSRSRTAGYRPGGAQGRVVAGPGRPRSTAVRRPCRTDSGRLGPTRLLGDGDLPGAAVDVRHVPGDRRRRCYGSKSSRVARRSAGGGRAQRPGPDKSRWSGHAVAIGGPRRVLGLRAMRPPRRRPAVRAPCRSAGPPRSARTGGRRGRSPSRPCRYAARLPPTPRDALAPRSTRRDARWSTRAGAQGSASLRAAADSRRPLDHRRRRRERVHPTPRRGRRRP